MNRTKAGGWLFLVEVLWVMAVIYFIMPHLPAMGLAQNLIFSEVIFLVPVLIYILLTKIRLKDWIMHERLELSTALMVLLFTVLIMPVMSWLNLFSMLFANNYVNNSVDEMANMPLWLGLLTVAVIPAVTEEFIYRGIYYRSFRGKGFWQAALACGLVFGISHLNFNQFSYALALGILFCGLMEVTGSIFATMLAHFLINGWSVIVSRIQQPLLEFLQKMQQAAGQPVTDINASLTQADLFSTLRGYTLVAAVSGCMAFGVMVWIAKHCRREEYVKNLLRSGKSEEPGKTVLTIPLIIGAVVGIVYMIAREILF